MKITAAAWAKIDAARQRLADARRTGNDDERERAYGDLVATIGGETEFLESAIAATPPEERDQHEYPGVLQLLEDTVHEWLLADPGARLDSLARELGEVLGLSAHGRLALLARVQQAWPHLAAA